MVLLVMVGVDIFVGVVAIVLIVSDHNRRCHGGSGGDSKVPAVVCGFVCVHV